MQKNKAISLITQIYNKLSSKTFISKACSVHPTCLPLYVCLNCIKEEKILFCEECFKNHNCNNKVKTQISQWVGKQQQYISNMINSFQRQSDATKSNIQLNRITIKSLKNPGLTLNQLNKQITSLISSKMEIVQRYIENNYIKEIIQNSIKNKIDDYIISIQLSLNGITDIFSINDIVHKIQAETKNVQGQISNQQKIAEKKVTQMYKIQTKKIFLETFNKIWEIDEVANQNDFLKQNEKQSIDIIINEAQQQKIHNDIQQLKQKQKDYIVKINQLQQMLRKQSDVHKNKQKQMEDLIKTHQKQVKSFTQTISQLKQNLLNLNSIQNQKIERQNKIKILQAKCQDYQKQIDHLVRESVNDRQQPQKRYNIQQAAKTINQLSQQYHLTLIQARSKDRKIAELIAEINKLKINSQIKEGKL